MPAGTRRAIAMFTDFFAAADLEATARRTGFVQRTAKITGTLLLALVPVGTGREGQTTLAHLAAKGTPWCQPGAVSPEAMPQRMHQKALAFLQDRSSPNSHLSPQSGMRGCLLPCIKGIWLTALALHSLTTSTRRCPVRAGVPRKPAPRCKLSGMIHAVCWTILR